MNERDVDIRLETAVAIIRDAGALALEYFRDRDALIIEEKGVQDLVSRADRETEDLILSRLKAAFPEDAILAEETGAHGDTSAVWVIDPIDGTDNYLRGNPYWCVAIALVVDGTVEFGLTLDPNTDELYLARRGEGAWCNHRRLHVSKATTVERSKILLGFSYRCPHEPHAALVGRLLARRCEYARLGAGALSLAHVAAGRFEGYVELHMNAWDALGGLLLVAEAGGVVNDFLADDGLRRGNLVYAAAPGIDGFLREVAGC